MLLVAGMKSAVKPARFHAKTLMHFPKCEMWVLNSPMWNRTQFLKNRAIGLTWDMDVLKPVRFCCWKTQITANVFTWASFPPCILQGNVQKGHKVNRMAYWTDENSEFFARLHAHPSNSWSLRKLHFLLLPSTYPTPYSSHSWIPWIWKTTKPNPISFAIEVGLLPWARETRPKVITKPSQKHRKAWLGRDIKDPVLMLIIKHFASQRF